MSRAHRPTEGAEPFAAPPLVALVYRVGKGCRQYPFGTVEELEAWAARHPYKRETLAVHAYKKDRTPCGTKTLPASEAAAYVRQQGGGE